MYSNLYISHKQLPQQTLADCEPQSCLHKHAEDMQNTSLLHSDDGTISNLHHDIRSLESSLASLRSQTLQMELKLRELKEELLKAENTSTIQTPHQPHRSDDFSDRGDSRPLSPRQYQRYGRQMIVPGVGLGGWLLILCSSVWS